MPDLHVPPETIAEDGELRLTYAMMQYEWQMTILAGSGVSFDGIEIMRSLLAEHGWALVDLGRPEAMPAGHYTTLTDEEMGKLASQASEAARRDRA